MGEKLVRSKNGFLPSFDLIPTQQHQIFEEILQFEKELGGMVYYQRCLERRNY